jgi:arylsulfatase A-like enzyme
MGRAYAVEQSVRPNVLFIMTDQQTIGAMSAAGNPYVNTPNMDALAKTGVRFEQSYCTAPVCSPSRSSLVTSRMPHETGVPHNLHQNFDVSLPNMGTIFREAGYRTAWAGKWHSGGFLSQREMRFRVSNICNPYRVRKEILTAGTWMTRWQTQL